MEGNGGCGNSLKRLFTVFISGAGVYLGGIGGDGRRASELDSLGKRCKELRLVKV